MSGCACWHGGTWASQDCGAHPTHLGMAANLAWPTSVSWAGRWLCVKLPAAVLSARDSPEAAVGTTEDPPSPMPLPSGCGFLAIVSFPLPSFLPIARVVGFPSLPLGWWSSSYGG